MKILSNLNNLDMISDGDTYKSDLKIIVVGSSGNRKTSYVNKWTKNEFTENYKATIVSEFGFKIVEINGKIYRISQEEW